MGCTSSTDGERSSSGSASEDPAAITYVLNPAAHPAVAEGGAAVIALIDGSLQQKLAAFGNGSFPAAGDDRARSAMPLVDFYTDADLAAASTERREKSTSSRRHIEHDRRLLARCSNPLLSLDATDAADDGPTDTSPVAADIFGADILSTNSIILNTASATTTTPRRRPPPLSQAARVLRFSPSTSHRGSLGSTASSSLLVQPLVGEDVQPLPPPLAAASFFVANDDDDIASTTNRHRHHTPPSHRFGRV